MKLLSVFLSALFFSGCAIHPAHKPMSPIKHKKQSGEIVHIPHMKLEDIRGIEQKHQGFHWCKHCPQITPKVIIGQSESQKSENHKNMQASVYFDFNQFALTTSAKETLNHLVSKIDAGSWYIHISGYTDSVGGKKVNRWLAGKRAAAVKTYIQHHIRNMKEVKVAYRTFARGKCCFVQMPSFVGKNRRVEINVERRTQ